MYVAASTTTIGMVLAQENPNDQEHMIYYLSKSLIDSETRYSRMEKLALATVIVVQKFYHYILLCATIVLVDQNPMYYIFYLSGAWGQVFPLDRYPLRIWSWVR